MSSPKGQQVADVEADECAEILVQELISLQACITTAESCTGGLIAAAITSVPRSSTVFRTGIVSYSNASKRRLLGVAADTLYQHGAVSEATVLAMAEGALQRDRADVAIAVSGIAGPDGGSPDKPVGTVWIGWATSLGCRSHNDAQHFHFLGDRRAVRNAAVVAALRGTIARLRAANNVE